MQNIQRRSINAPAPVVGALLDRLATADDPLWPSNAWSPLRLDAGLTPGSRGGHGPIRYSVAGYEPGRRIQLDFDPRLGIVGHHELRVTPDGPQRCELTHTIVASTHGRMRLLWPLAVRWLHEALIQDLLDNAERLTTGQLRRPATWSLRVRVMRRAFAPGTRKVALPAGAHLAAAATADGDVDVLDAWQLPTRNGTAQQWCAAAFADAPPWVVAALRLRNRLARLVGMEAAEHYQIFGRIAATDDEVLIGGNNRDLALRISIHVSADTVTCTTLTRARTRRARVYLAVIRLVHPVVVRSMLRRAARTMRARADTKAAAA